MHIRIEVALVLCMGVLGWGGELSEVPLGNVASF